jgi:hypothetical protein
MSSLIVDLAGRTRSERTSFAEAVARRTGLSVASFGGDVERGAHDRRFAVELPEVPRAILMAVGTESVADLECRVWAFPGPLLSAPRSGDAPLKVTLLAS